MTSRPSRAAEAHPRIDLHSALRVAEAVTALAQLGLHTARGIADLAGEVHGVIARSWSGARTARSTPLPYHIVSRTCATLAVVASAWPRGDDATTTAPAWRRFVGALNGVMGDELAASHNALAIRMSVRDAGGAAIDLADLRRSSRRGVVLFVHGLCASEVEWHTPAHRALVADLIANGFATGWLRYNSGRGIPDNGSALADLLEAAGGRETDSSELILIGHSMGGLVIRSACHSAHLRQQNWLRDLRHAAYLGSPHHGVPLERAGNFLNGAVGLTPYSAPFMRLGNIRSRGIKDLRFGRIAADEPASDAYFGGRRTIVPLVPHVRHLLVSASLHADPEKGWFGDGLVPIASARALHRDAALNLTAPDVERVHLAPLGHIALMHDERTCDALRTWLGLWCESSPIQTSPGEDQ